MGKDAWLVEVESTGRLPGRTAEWQDIVTCADSGTALAVADALRNLMATGLVGCDRFQIRVRMAGGEV